MHCLVVFAKTPYRAVLLFSVGCAKKVETASVKGMDMPPWALNQPDLCGVGMVKFRGNLGAAKSAAESRARVDISKQIETKVKAMVKDYISEGGNADGDFSEEQIDQTSITISITCLINLSIDFSSIWKLNLAHKSIKQ